MFVVESKSAILSRRIVVSYRVLRALCDPTMISSKEFEGLARHEQHMYERLRQLEADIADAEDTYLSVRAAAGRCLLRQRQRAGC
jgi:hypothetical protein